MLLNLSRISLYLIYQPFVNNMALMDNDLLCNFKKCRKRLINLAWVTSCSHVFCEEDGSREFAKELLCPSCNTELTGKFDIVRVDLQPSDQYKSMMLAGLKPEIIMEIASRGINFWMYQASQERVFYEYAQKKVKESANKVRIPLLLMHEFCY